jgi:hypothetical protein
MPGKYSWKAPPFIFRRNASLSPPSLFGTHAKAAVLAAQIDPNVKANISRFSFRIALCAACSCSPLFKPVAFLHP